MSNIEIWNEGFLKPIESFKSDKKLKDIAAVVVNRDRPDLTDNLVEQLMMMKQDVDMDIYVIEMGSTNKSKYASFYYDDKDYSGKCYGHNVGIRYAKANGNYRFFWILMNDLVFDKEDSIKKLIDVADRNSKIGILSPTELDAGYPGCKPIEGNEDFHIVTTCDYLGFLIKSEVVDRIGFLNPSFKYCWGAIHELAYQLYSAGWFVAYCDSVNMKHLGGTTYGKTKNTVSRDEYQFRAKEFAARYFVENYGKNWDDIFTTVLPENIKINTFKMHRRLWETALSREERNLYNSKSGDIIDSLNPWYYPVIINGRKIIPGIGSKESAEDLCGRVSYMHKLLIDETSKRYSFRGKSILDVGSNCGYWSARYAELGAISLVAIEGRLEYVKQGKLYWETNKFMNSYKFIHGNVLSDKIWGEIKKLGSFDFTLCSGILYHIPDFEKLLNFIDSVTREAILIDTRVSRQNDQIMEPGGWFFDAIVETRAKKVPSYENLLKILSKNFHVDAIRIDDSIPKGLKGNDDYSQGKRVCLLAKKAS
jgi:2-polyprenyl-3-methyl-5-hydroxy-6-metoxy-1,4-benzoquinol methylase